MKKIFIIFLCFSFSLKTIQALPFSSNQLLRRFGSNSYITRIPLYFPKESAKTNIKKIEYKEQKTIDKKNRNN